MYAAGFLAAATRVATTEYLRFTNYFEPVNEGAIQVYPFNATLTPVGEVMALFAQHQGRTRIALPDAAFGANIDTVATVGNGTVKASGHTSRRDHIVLPIPRQNACIGTRFPVASVAGHRSSWN